MKFKQEMGGVATPLGAAATPKRSRSNDRLGKRRGVLKTGRADLLNKNRPRLPCCSLSDEDSGTRMLDNAEGRKQLDFFGHGV